MDTDNADFYDDLTAEDTPAVADSTLGDDYRTTYNKARMDAIRDSSEYKTMRLTFRGQCEKIAIPLADGTMSKGAPCFNCGRGIDYRLKHPHPDSWSLEHIRTVKEAPELILDVANWAASHLDCNQRRGTDDKDAMDIGEPSEIW